MVLTYDKAREYFNYNPETGELIWKKGKGSTARVGSKVGSFNTGGYLKTIFNGKHYAVHRIIWLWVYGEWPKHQINHKNVIPSDNRLCNLEDIPLRENCQKKKCHMEGRLPGVRRTKNSDRFCARIVANKRRIIIGTFNTEQEAYEAYLNGCQELKDGKILTIHRKETRGVTYNKSKQRWITVASIDGKRKHLGTFNTEQEALDKYREAVDKNTNVAIQPQGNRPQLTGAPPQQKPKQ